MMDVQAREIPERDLEAALRLDHLEAVKYIQPQLRLAAKAGKQKKEYQLSMVLEGTNAKIRNLAAAPTDAVFIDPAYGSLSVGEALENIAHNVKGILEEEGDEESIYVLLKTVDTVRKQVDYQEKQFAQGVILTTFMRREGAPKERELLCGRVIDRPMRPLFPAEFNHEVQVMAGAHVMAAIATSAALVLSNIPQGGPVGMIRLGRIDGKLIINPSIDEVMAGKQDPDVMAASATSAALVLSNIPWGGPVGMIRLGRIDGKLIIKTTIDEGWLAFRC